MHRVQHFDFEFKEKYKWEQENFYILHTFNIRRLKAAIAFFQINITNATDS